MSLDNAFALIERHLTFVGIEAPPPAARLTIGSFWMRSDGDETRYPLP